MKRSKWDGRELVEAVVVAGAQAVAAMRGGESGKSVGGEETRWQVE